MNFKGFLIESIFWDPPREAFTIPYFNHPVVWYGVLFVTGFFLAYFIINPILSRFLIRTGKIYSPDILNWNTLLKTIKNTSHPIALKLREQFDPKTRNQILEASSVSTDLQKKILDGLNKLLKEGLGTRQELTEIGIASPKQTAYTITDRLCWFVVLGTIIGARLGAVFFYDWDYFKDHPSEIFMIWHGGLASHGGVLGVILSLYLFSRYIHRKIPELSFLHLMDYVAVPSALVGAFIRLGNFVNQEILGTPTSLPWGVIFGHPADGSFPDPRHPVQLYEAFAYLISFFILWIIWKREPNENHPGKLVGALFILIFGSRFFLEFFKSTQDSVLDPSFLQMGQVLSLPFVLLGSYLIWRSKKNSNALKTNSI